MGDARFLVSLHSLHPLSLTSLSPPTSTSTVLLVVLFLWLNVWSHHIWCAILLNDNMVLVPEGPWCVFYAARRQVYWGLTHIVVFLLVLRFDITNAQTHYTQGPLDWHTHQNVYLYHLLCAQMSYLYYIKWLNKWLND